MTGKAKVSRESAKPNPQKKQSRKARKAPVEDDYKSIPDGEIRITARGRRVKELFDKIFDEP